jgi:hypothetical protein
MDGGILTAGVNAWAREKAPMETLSIIYVQHKSIYFHSCIYQLVSLSLNVFLTAQSFVIFLFCE